MGNRGRLLSSSIGKKLVSGASGLLLCGFIVVHLAGNLLLLVGRDAFNEYAHLLHTLAHGAFVPIAEIGLAALFVAHIVSGIRVWVDRRRARPVDNVEVGYAGGPSRKSLASRSMVVTGLLLMVFVIVHVTMFRIWPIEDAGYLTTLDGEPARDLYRWVVEWFQSAPVVGGYVVAMLLLGVHLRHGFWSAFQSLGANNPRAMPLITSLGAVFAVLMAIGFLMIPLWIYVFVDVPVASVAAGGSP